MLFIYVHVIVGTDLSFMSYIERSGENPETKI